MKPESCWEELSLQCELPFRVGAYGATQLLLYELLISSGGFRAEDGIFMDSQALGNVDALSREIEFLSHV